MSTLTSRIGTMLQRRRIVSRGTAAAVGEAGVHMSGHVVSVGDEATPLTDILAKSRVLGRPPRQTEYLHVSDLIGKCIRRIAIVETLNMPVKPQGLSLTDSLTFAQGDAIHDVLKNRSVSGGPDMVWGNWSCRCHTTQTVVPSLFSQVDHEARCPACKGPLSEYVEVPMRDEELKIVGTPDLLLYLPGPDAFFITELKSISHEQWKDLGRPIPEHVIQVLFYWHLMNKLGYPLTQEVSVGYATKGWLFGKSPVKEFTFNAYTQMSRLEPYFAEARAIAASRAGGPLPPRVLCASASSTEAKKCDVCQTCFGGSDDLRPVSISIASALGHSSEAPRAVVRRAAKKR